MRRLAMLSCTSVAVCGVLALSLSASASPSTHTTRQAGGAGERVLRVGTYHGIKGQYRSIQAASCTSSYAASLPG